jgi:hypothetical protein
MLFTSIMPTHAEKNRVRRVLFPLKRANIAAFCLYDRAAGRPLGGPRVSSAAWHRLGCLLRGTTRPRLCTPVACTSQVLVYLLKAPPTGGTRSASRTYAVPVPVCQCPWYTYSIQYATHNTQHTQRLCYVLGCSVLEHRHSHRTRKQLLGTWALPRLLRLLRARSSQQLLPPPLRWFN